MQEGNNQKRYRKDAIWTISICVYYQKGLAFLTNAMAAIMAGLIENSAYKKFQKFF